ncbi:unnamed protein product [Sphenostylis stenocarpa]|uniref:FLZ-type domain-containing protein n=1 Tax=Sphenostylis stenocarpa TaxID=92480 RepID=A0AA86V6D8_9FABA|nr:unnamed protein product [Sphenostylis stenocarpa]
MLLGKRPRPPIMKRTTSMSGGMAVESPTTNEELVSDNTHHDHEPNIKPDPLFVAMGTHNELVPDLTKNVFEAKGSSYEEYGERLMGMGMVIPLSPTTSNNPRLSHNHTTNTNINTSHFLRTCGLCKCRLAPGRDIYMYRGDTAFCSLECREKQMKQDQRKEKCKAGSNKEHHRASPPGKASTKSETAACN